MANCGGGPEEKTSSNREENFGELNKAEIKRLRKFLGTLSKRLGMCSLPQTGKSSISHTFKGLKFVLH